MLKWVIPLIAICSCSKAELTYSLIPQEANTNSLIIGLHIMNESEVWASGTNSTVLRTLNGGDSWEVFEYPQADTLQFRDIYGFPPEEAIVLSIGEGEASQILKFRIPENWSTTYVMDHPKGFLDCIDFWDERRGLAYGDSFDETPFILRTNDGGESWERVANGLPLAGKGEGGFAASGTCIEIGENGQAWIGTGAGGNARLLYTPDFGNTWQPIPTPMVKGPSAGITSVRFSNDLGFIAGGDLAITDTLTNNLFVTNDLGSTWQACGPPKTMGAFYGSALNRFGGQHIIIICGPNGADISLDNGASWVNILRDDLWTTDLHSSGTGWIAGRDGKLYKIQFSI